MSFPRKSLTFNCRGRLLEFSRPVVMAIVNLSPDSFYHSIDFRNKDQVLSYAAGALEDGATILDLGGMSTRPGAAEISVEEEWSRLKPALVSIRREFPEAFISVDSYRAGVVKRAMDEGVDLVNDVSGGSFDPLLPEFLKGAGVPYILMHNRGKSNVMQKMTDYNDLLAEVYDFFTSKIHLLRSKGIYDIAIDPGFGFSKTIDQNYELLKNLECFNTLGCPLLVGISRKSMMYKPLGLEPSDVLHISSALNFLALTKGADILRVHDVKETADCIRIFERYST